jgi:hypothetical protein
MNEPCKTAGGKHLRRDLLIKDVRIALLHVDRIMKAAKWTRTRQVA